MKRCPQCYEAYDEVARFCETDGSELLADPTLYPESPVVVQPASPVWLPAAVLGVLIGVGIAAAIFAALSLSSRPATNEPQVVREAAQFRESVPSSRVAAVADPAPTVKPAESPSPEVEAEAEPEASPVANEKKTVAAQFNQGPISTGKKSTANESEAGLQTVIEMHDGSTLDVDAAWEDKQGIWYRRSGLVSFVESSRVKAITTRKGAPKTPELQDR